LSHYDILVIGAGASGLAAARLLARHGARVALLEARSRVGGRIWTQHVPAPDGTGSLPVELGAEFIHGRPNETFELLRESGLAWYELRRGSMQFIDGRLVTPEASPRAFDVIDEMERWLARQPPGFDSSFAQYLEQVPLAPDVRKAATSFVEGFNAADSRRVSVASLVRQQRAEDAEDGGRAFHVEAGYDALPRFLAEGFTQAGGTLLLGHVVRRVQWRAGAVSVQGETAGGQPFAFDATQSVITLPLGILQAGSVEFSPEPAGVMSAARQLAFGAARRMTLVFQRAFWRDLAPQMEQVGFLFAGDEFARTWWTPMPNPAPMITAWVGGPRAQIPDDSWRSQCLSTLARITSRPLAQIEQQLVSAHSHDWDADEFARGAYSYVPAGALEASERIALPVEQTLFFAGEHIDLSSNWGTVHAAMRSGLRAARELIGREGGE
jgi:monoamine oxidase